MRKAFVLYLATTLGFLILDQALKAYIRGAIPIGGSFGGWPWPGVFEITLTKNYGIAFGMFQGKGQYLTPVALIIAGFATVYSFRHPKEGWLTHLAMGLLASGAIGNMIDRAVFGRVTDMFWIRAINFPVFNVADACITVAAVLLLFAWGRGEQKDPLPETSPNPAE